MSAVEHRGTGATIAKFLADAGRRLSEAVAKTPPITLAYVFSSLVATVLASVLNGNKWPELLSYDASATVTKLQLWRPLAAFLYFGPFGFNYVLTLQFLWMYMSQLEKANSRRPAEFLLMLVFGVISLLASYSALGLSSRYLGHNLSSYLVYMWSKLFQGTDVSLMDLFTMKAEWLPWFFCAQVCRSRVFMSYSPRN